MTTTPTAPGWHDDPSGRRRWWDGKHWGAYAPWDQGTAPRVVRSSSPSLRIDRRYLIDPTEPLHRPRPTAAPAPAKRAGVAYALLVLLGTVGAHRFYVGRKASALTMIALTASACALLLAPLEGFPLVRQLSTILKPEHAGLSVAAAVALWLLIDLFRTAGFVAEVNRRALSVAQPRAYYRGWPAA